MAKHPNKQNSKANTLKERQREQRENLILEVAYDILTEKGYHDTSMDEIAAQVGISKGTLYLHFKSKDDLVSRLIEQQAVNFLSIINQVIHQKATVRTRLEYILLETYKGVQEGRQFLVALHALGLNHNMIADRLADQVALGGFVEVLITLFEEGKQSGELIATVPTSIMVSSFVCLMRMYENEPWVSTDEASPEELVASVSQVFFQGILAP